MTPGLADRLRRRGIIPGEPLGKAVATAMRKLAEDEVLPDDTDVAVTLPPVGLTAWLRPVPQTGWSLLYTFTETRVIVRNAQPTDRRG